MADLKPLIIGALISLSGIAQAHTHLEGAVPAEGSTVSAPERIVLKFSETARVTALTIEPQGATAQKLVPLPSTAGREIAVPAPHLAPGKYTVHWRVLSEDGHVMSGALHFTVSE